MAVISDDNIVKQKFVLAGDVVSLLTSLLSLPLIAVFGYQRYEWQRRIQNTTGRRFNVAAVTLLLSYISIFLFILILTVLLHIRGGRNLGLCEATVLICLSLYIVTKAMNLLFLIERLYIISWPTSPRHRTPEYVATCLGVFVPYAVVVGLCLHYRIALFTGDDVCVIGIQFYGLIPLIVVEVSSYLYLTLRFLYPLVMVHFGGPGLLLPLRKVVMRTCVGTGITTVSLLAVKISLTMFNGEPAWLCCMTCKIDALIATICLHWMSKPEPQEDQSGNAQALGVGFEGSGSTAYQSSRSTATEWTREFGIKDAF